MRLGPQTGWARAATGLGVVQMLFLGFLVNRQLTGAGSRNWDLGIFTNAVRTLADGKSFMPYRGMDVLGHHFNAILYLLAPVSWLGGGSRALSLIQVGVLCLGAWPAYLLGRDRMGFADPARSGFVVAVVYLLHPTVSGLSWWMFHPESLALPALLFLWWAATNERWKLCIACAVFVALCREDLLLALALFGLVIAVVLRHAPRAKTVGGFMAVVSMAGWLVVTQIVMPARIGTDEPYYVKDFWGHLGNTMPEVITTALTSPARATEQVRGTEGLAFAATLIAPTGGTALLNPLTLLPAGPQVAAVVLSNDDDSRQVWHHHGAMYLSFSIISMVEFLRRVRAKRLRLAEFGQKWVIGWAFVSWLVMTPLSTGQWTSPNATSAAMQRAVRQIPDGAVVAATVTPGNLVAERETAYTWPNPYRKWKRGYEFAPLPATSTVDYLLLLDSEVTATSAELRDELLGSSGQFVVVSHDDGVLLAQRRR
jgi:uncharacterized membrane protein